MFVYGLPIGCCDRLGRAQALPRIVAPHRKHHRVSRNRESVVVDRITHGTPKIRNCGNLSPEFSPAPLGPQDRNRKLSLTGSTPGWEQLRYFGDGTRKNRATLPLGTQ